MLGRSGGEGSPSPSCSSLDARYQLALFAVFAGGYAAALVIESRSPGPLKDIALMGAIGAGVAAIKIVPVYEIVRRDPRSEIAVNFYGAPFTPTAGEILHQMFVSRAESHDPGAWMPYILNVGCYVGWVPLALAAYALLRNFRKNAVWFGLALLFIWIALGPAAPINLWALLPIRFKLSTSAKLWGKIPTLGYVNRRAQRAAR